MDPRHDTITVLEKIAKDLDQLLTVLKTSSLDSSFNAKYTTHSMSKSQEGGNQKMISTAEISEAVQELLLNSSLRYYKLFCYCCHREWISDAMKPGETYTPPKSCSFLDCRNREWNDPVKGAIARNRWLKRQKMKQAS